MAKSELPDYVVIDENSISDYIHTLRGQKVMLDFDLASIYGYETRYLNRQVHNNINKFDEDFMFQLTKEELNEILKCKNFTSSWGGARKLPYAFTEQGIYMLMTVLRGELAVSQSKQLIRCFKSMKDYIVESGSFLTNTNSYIESKFASYDKRFEKIENKLDMVMDNFIDPSTHKHFLVMNGEKVEADIAYRSIYELAKKSIVIVDDYIGIKTLEHLKACKRDVRIVVCTDNVARNGLSQTYIDDFVSDTGIGVLVKPTHNKIHDRYIVIDYGFGDERFYLCGPSSKDAGNRIATIIEIDDKEIYRPIIDDLLEDE